jgi:hypothetical protein
MAKAEETLEPEWILVSSGFLGMGKTLIPLLRAHQQAEGVGVPYSKDRIKSAPEVGTGEAVSEKDEVQLFEHYRVPCDGSSSVTLSCLSALLRTAPLWSGAPAE